jgi:hypothetical protein
MAELYDPDGHENDASDGYEPFPAEESYDPFAASNVHQAQLIVLLRIYDLLAVQGLSVNPEATRPILELHGRGGIMSPPPYFIPPEDIADAMEQAHVEQAHEEASPDSQSTDNLDT